MQKNLNVNLTFNANTTAAKAQIKDLQSNLTSLTSASGISNLGTVLSSNIMQGVHAAAQLKTALASSMQGGNLNLAQFNANLKSSGTSLVTFGQNLMKLGPQGQQAFQQLSNSITQAQIPLTKTKTLLNSLAGTFANVIKWQIASSTINTLVRSIGSALDYTKDLNESLNNIRIVTGLSAEAMDTFAKKANEASKKLKTSTTDYTNAALIYYQQGLEGKAVEERAETTLKLANVTSQSAEEVSQNMTAIWNNFYDGSRSLEYYADVITALGAATASSSDEIAQGLEKFAAIANTVGLSYEYATTALATITAQTRQSADVVGTAFKTLFARIQDLELGNTLEDGTTLGQYSEALYKVGINIKDSNGELKGMNQILDEMGAKWQQIDKDQQVALAKSVAGIRQYTQLIALMDNWDTFEMNLTVAEDAEGTLERQQKIWAESWEAAEKRVKASAQGLYEGLISDDFFIDLNNVLAELIDGFKYLVDAMGGLRGLLPLLIAGIAQFAGPKIITGLRGMSQEMAMTNKAAQEEMLVLKELAVVTAGLTGNSSTRQQEMQLKTLDLRKQALNLTRDLTKQEEIQLNGLFDTLNTMQQITNELEEQARLTKETATKDALGSIYKNVPNADGKKAGTRPAKITEEDLNEALGQRINVGTTGSGQGLTINKAIKKAVKTEGWLMDSSSKEEFETRSAELSKQGHDMSAYKWNDDMGPQLEEVNGKLGIASKTAKEAGAAMKQSFGISKNSASKSAKAVDEYAANMVEAERSARGAAKGQEAFNKQAGKVKKGIDQLNKKPMGQTFIEATAAIGTLTMSISSLVQGWDTLVSGLEDGNLTFKEILSVITSVTMAIPMFMMGIKGLGTAFGVTTALTAAATAVEKGYSAEKAKTNILTALGITLTEGEIIADSTRASVQLASAAAEELVNGSKKRGIALALASKAASILEAVGLGSLIPVKYADAEASATAGAATMAMVWSIGLLVLAIAGLALAIVGIIALFKAMSNAYNADAIAAEKAAKKAEELAEAYSRVKEEYDNLKQSLSDYEDAQNAIDKLKKGTDEWREAIFEANNQVLELLRSYPELQKYVQTGEGGRLTIDQSGWDYILDQQKNKLVGIQNAYTQANYDSKVAKNKSDRTNLLRNELDTFNEEVDYALSATLGSPVGAIGAIATTIANEVQANRSEAVLDAIQEKVNEQGQEFFTNYESNLKNLGVDIPEDLMKQLKENQAAVEELTLTNKQLAEQEGQVKQQKVDNLLYGQEHFDDNYYGENMQKLAQEEYDKVIADVKKDKNDFVTDGFFLWNANKGTEAGKNEVQRYLELKYGEKEAKKYKIKNFGAKNVKIKGENGTEKISYEDIASFLAEYDVADSAWDMANDMNKRSSELQLLNRKDDTGKALSSFFAEGNLDYLDNETYEKIKNSSIVITQEQAEMFGFASAAEAQAAFDKAVDSYDAAAASFNIAAKDLEAANGILKAGAQELEISEQALRAYTESLQATSGEMNLNKEQAAKMAVSHYRLGKGLNVLEKALEDNLHILKDSTINSLDYNEALGAVKEALESAFGVKVSADFIKNTKNLELMEKVANNDTEALGELKKALVDDFILHLEIEDGSEELQNEIHRLMELAENSPIGTKLTIDNGDALNALNSALEAGTTTIEEIESMFHNANLSMPEYHTIKVPNTTKSESHSIIKTPTWWGGTKESTMDQVTYNTTWSSIPYFGNNRPQYEEVKDAKTGEISYKVKEGTGVETGPSGLEVSVASNDEANKDILEYQGDKDFEKSEDKKDSYKKLDEELERYHEIKEIISDLEREMEKLNKAKDRAYGDKKIEAIKEEISLLHSQIEANKILEQQMRDNLTKDKANISKFGAQFDEQGRLTNYDEMYAQEISRYNRAVDSYDKDSKQRKTAEERWENFEKYISQYEETLNELEDLTQETAEKVHEELDRQLEGIDYAVEVLIEINDTQLKNLEIQLKRLEDDLFDGAQRIENLTKQVDENLEDIQIYEQGIGSVLATAGADEQAIKNYLNGDASGILDLEFTDKQIQQLKTYTENLQEAGENIAELDKQIQEQSMLTFEAWHEKIEQNGEAFEHATSMAQSYKDIIDLLGKTRTGIDNSVLESFEKMEVAAANGKLANDKIQLDTTKVAREKAEEELAKAKERAEKTGLLDISGTEWEADIKKWEQEVENLNQQLMDDEQSFMSSWTQALTTATEVFSSQMDRAFEELEDKLAGSYKSMNELQESLDRDQTVADRYLDTGEQLYELSKLNRKIQKDIDSNDSPTAKKKLLDLQKTINEYQENGTEMSKYELEALQKRYDLKVAEIALEEAQNAKSVVRLQRDSEGNFGYVYTADENNIATAQQKYEDELEANRKLGVDQVNSITNAIVQNRTEMTEALKEIRVEDFEDEETYLKKCEEVAQHYVDQEEYLLFEYSKVVNGSKQLYEEEYKSYDGWSIAQADSSELLKNLTNEDRDEMKKNAKGFADEYNKAMEKMGISHDNPKLAAEQLKNALGSYKGGEEGEGFFGDMGKAAKGWYDNTDEIMKNAGSSIDGFGTDVKNAIEGTEDNKGIKWYISEAEQKTKEFGETAVKQYGDSAIAVSKWQEVYSPKVEDATNKTKALGDAIAALMDTNVKVIANVIDNGVASFKELYDAIQTKDVTITTYHKDVYDDTNNNPKTNGKPLQWTKVAQDFYGKTYYKNEQGEIYESSDIEGDPTKDNVWAALKSSAKKDNDYNNKLMANYNVGAGSVAKVNKEQYYINEFGQKMIGVNFKNGAQGWVESTYIDEKGNITDPTRVTFYSKSGAANEQILFISHFNNSMGYLRTKDGKILQFSGLLKAQSEGKLEFLDNNGNPLTGALSPNTPYRIKVYDDSVLNRADVKVEKTGDRIPMQPKNQPKLSKEIKYFYSGKTGDLPTALKNYDYKYSSYADSNYLNVPDDLNVVYLKDPDSGLYFMLQSSYGYGNKILGNPNPTETAKHLKTKGSNLDANSGYQKWIRGGKGARLWEFFDTGGYTGEWGPEGKLAVLHQKEIILNAHDTENFLTAIDMVRSMSNQLDQKVALMRYQNALDRFQAAFTTGNETLEQNIHITAEFPNATNHNEIEEAFRNLTNLASQYINRK